MKTAKSLKELGEILNEEGGEHVEVAEVNSLYPPIPVMEETKTEALHEAINVIVDEKLNENNIDRELTISEKLKIVVDGIAEEEKKIEQAKQTIKDSAEKINTYKKSEKELTKLKEMFEKITL